MWKLPAPAASIPRRLPSAFSDRFLRPSVLPLHTRIPPNAEKVTSVGCYVEATRPCSINSSSLTECILRSFPEAFRLAPAYTNTAKRGKGYIRRLLCGSYPPLQHQFLVAYRVHSQIVS